MWKEASNLLAKYNIDFSVWDIEYHQTGRFRVKKKVDFSWYYFDTIDYVLMYIQ